jgi:hypothetical protein
MRRASAANAGHQRWSFRPLLEALEGRDVPSTLTVVNTLDKGAGSLRDAVVHARDEDTIVFDQHLSGQTIALTSGTLVLKHSIDIEGPGAGLLSISGSDRSRVFDIGAGLTVTIAGLTITHGRAAGNWGGGGILNVGSTLNLVNDVFSDNRAIGSNADATSMGGGAVTNRNGGILTVTACGFTGNQAVGRRGGLGEGGAIWNLATATITGSTFTGNRAVGGDGGRVTGGSAFIGEANGGAIFNQTSAAHLTVVNSTFSDNEAVAGSGGRGDKGAELYFVGVATGGGITNGHHASLVVAGCTFTGNRAVGGSHVTGGATGQGGVGNAVGGALANLLGAVATVVSSTFDHNQAIAGSGNGGGGGAVTFSRGAGGAIANTLGAALTVSGCTLTANQAMGGAGAPGGNGGNGFGGGIFNDGRSTLEIRDSTVTDNRASGGAAGAGGNDGLGIGGGLYVAAGGTAYANALTLIFANDASTSDDDVFGILMPL